MLFPLLLLALLQFGDGPILLAQCAVQPAQVVQVGEMIVPPIHGQQTVVQGPIQIRIELLQLVLPEIKAAHSLQLPRSRWTQKLKRDQMFHAEDLLTIQRSLPWLSSLNDRPLYSPDTRRVLPFRR